MIGHRYTTGLLLALCIQASAAMAAGHLPPTPHGTAVPASAAGGGAPENDLCSAVSPQALSLGGTLTFSGTTTGATITDDYVPGSGLEIFNAPAVWHAFTTTECVDLRVEYCGTPSTFSDYWNVLSLDCPALNYVATSDYNTTDCSDGNPTVYFHDLPAGTYYYPVWVDEVTAAGPYVLTVTAGPCGGGPVAPENDDCASVTPEVLIVDDTLTFTGDNTGATSAGDFTEDSSFPNTPVVWHAFTTSTCADVTVSYCGQASVWENTLGILSTDCPSDSMIFFSTQGTCGDGNLIYRFDELAAGTYYVPVLYDPAHGAVGPYSIDVSAAACSGGPVGPVNDDCASVTPEALAVDDTLTFTGDNTGATSADDFAAGSPFLGTPVVWHAFTTSTCADVTVSYCGQAPVWENVLGILSTDCPSDSVIFFSTQGTCGDGNLIYRFDELAAGTYYVPVLYDPDHDAAGPYSIEVSAAACSSGPVGPVNDDCASVTPEALVVDDTLTFTGDNTGATSAGDFAAGSPFLGTPVVWHAFTTSACADVTVSYCGQDPVWANTLGILSVDCPSDSVIFFTTLDDTTCVDGNTTYRFEALAAGTYYVPVLYDPDHDAAGPYTIEVSAAACQGGPTVPVNDNCSSVTPQALASNGTLTFAGDNTGATPTGDFAEGSPFLGEAVVWHAFTTSACTNVTVSYCGQDPAWERTLGILSTDCPADSVIPYTTLDTDSCGDGNVAYRFAELAAGTYYLPVLWDPAAQAEGPYSVMVHADPCPGTTPANDECAAVTAQELTTGGSVVFEGDNTGATDSEGLGYGSAWEAFTLAECADVTIAYCGTLPAFGVVAAELYTSCPPAEPIPASVVVAEGCDFGDANTVLRFNGLAAGTYYIPVRMEAGVAEGPYTITATATACIPPPANDDCAIVIPVDVVLPAGCDTASVEGDNTGATPGGSEPACGFPGSPFQDVWYTFNSGGNVEVTITLEAGSILGQGVEIFHSCADTSIFCSMADEPHVVAVEPNSDYLLRVFSYSDVGQAGTYTLCIAGDVGTGVRDRSAAAFTLFPNPGDGDMTLVYAGASADVVIDLFDLTGRALYTERTHLLNGQQHPLALAGRLAAGTYALRVSTPRGTAEQRVVVR